MNILLFSTFFAGSGLKRISKYYYSVNICSVSVAVIGQSECFLVNKYDVALFNAIFDRRYFEAMKLLRQRQPVTAGINFK